MKKTFLALLALPLLALSACTNPETTSLHTLEAMGFRDIRVSGWTFAAGFNCSDKDGWARNFAAIGVNGRPISGTVCGGYIGKGATVRFD